MRLDPILRPVMRSASFRPSNRGMFSAKHIENKTKRGELYIYDEIGFWGITPNMVADHLKEVGKVDILDVFINSPGGSVFDGIAIHNLIKRFDAKVIVTIDGIAASIASVIAMAGSEIRMPKNTTMMIHNAIAGCYGTAEDMRRIAATLDGITDTIIDVYIDRTGIDKAKVKKMMSDETWMNAVQCKENGFCDKILEDEEADVKDMAFSMLNKFQNTPEHLRELSKDSRLAVARMHMRSKKFSRASPAKDDGKPSDQK